MVNDIFLNEEEGGWITIKGKTYIEGDTRVNGQYLTANTWDFILDSKDRRGGRAGPRRALVHDFQDGLTVNYNKDYTGGLTLLGVKKLNLRAQSGLPEKADLGDVALVRRKRDPLVDGLGAGGLGVDDFSSVSLWICVGNQIRVARDALAIWRQIPLGDTKAGGD